MLKLMVVLGMGFASTFLFLNLTGILTVDRIEKGLELAKTISPLIVGLTIATLLFADLFVAMPTLTIMLLGGYFLGPVFGAGFAISGLIVAGLTGFFLSKRFGDAILRILISNNAEREKAIRSFHQYGTTTILLSRAMPILPEVSACMAGLTGMPFIRFIGAWLLSVVPYAIIATYAGSISSVANPQPAIFTAIGLTGSLMLAWYVFRRASSVNKRVNE